MSAADKAEQKLREDRKLQGSGGGGSGKRVPRTSPSNNGRRGGGRNKKSKAQQQPYDQLVKILLLGDSGVGKTCLLTRFAEKKYSPSLVTTAGIDFKVQYFEVNGVKIKCQIWDTAGQERFHVITKAYYKGAHGIALVYDTTDRKTLDNIDYWLGNISDNAQDEVEQVLIANKVDLPRVINEEEGTKVAEARGIRYLETSAKTGTNVRAGKIPLIYWLNFSILCSSQSLTFPLFLFLYLLFFLFCTAFYDLACRIVEKNGGGSKQNGTDTKLITLDNKSKKKGKKKGCNIL
jgi:Ras-related protein Rab-8A